MTALNVGNTLILLPNDGFIEEADSSWNALQTLQAISFGYPDWRESLCGPPSRRAATTRVLRVCGA